MTSCFSETASAWIRIARGGAFVLGSCIVLTACTANASVPGTSSTSSTTSTSTTTTLGLSQPNAQKPITILDVGDSLGEDLGIGLEDTLGTSPIVHVVQAAVGDTGLARPDYYNWPAHLAADLAKYHPQLVTILVGGNDAQSFDADNQVVVFGSTLWHTIYTGRVAVMMSEVLKAHARLLWVGLPIMANTTFAASMATLNAIYKSEAALHRGVEFMPTWSLFSNSEGQFSTYLTNSSGQSVLARDPDGIHLAVPGGCDIAAVATIKDAERIWHIRLGV
jgi:hypothetical protein